MSDAPIGFWVQGGKHGRRVPVDALAAFAGFAACDEKARIDAEHYLSAFTFGEEFRAHMLAAGSTAGYDGPCGADYLWFDVDVEGNLDAAMKHTQVLALAVTEKWGLRDEDLLLFFSGSKGFHLGLPTVLWSPSPSFIFNRVAKRVAMDAAAAAGVAIDTTIYDKVRLFRAPNSVHPKTGLRKCYLTLEELLSFDAARILELAARPREFEIPEPRGDCPGLRLAWDEAAGAVAAEDAALRARAAATAAAGDGTSVNQLTMEFIREGARPGGSGTAPEDGRHNRLFAAACDLGEFGCPPALAHALLTPSALDSGISPSEARRHIDNGLKRAARKGAANGG